MMRNQIYKRTSLIVLIFGIIASIAYASTFDIRDKFDCRIVSRETPESDVWNNGQWGECASSAFLYSFSKANLPDISGRLAYKEYQKTNDYSNILSKLGWGIFMTLFLTALIRAIGWVKE